MMDAQTYITREGDVVDWVCWKHYGRVSNAILFAVLEANFGLADYGPVLPHGVRIVLPLINPAEKIAGLYLWN